MIGMHARKVTIRVSDTRPRRAAIGRAPELNAAEIDDARVGWMDSKRDVVEALSTENLRRIDELRPTRAAIKGAKDAATGSDENILTVARIDDNSGNREARERGRAEHRPRLAAIARFKHPIAVVAITRIIILAGSGINDAGIARING